MKCKFCNREMRLYFSENFTFGYILNYYVCDSCNSDCTLKIYSSGEEFQLWFDSKGNYCDEMEF